MSGTVLVPDLLSMTGIGQRSETFRFDLLDQHNSYVGILDVEADTAPTISNNINRRVKRSLTNLVLPPSVTREIDTLSNRVRPWMVLQDGTEYPLGVFLFADASRTEAAYSSVAFVRDPAVDEDPIGHVTTGSLLDQLSTLDQGSRGVSSYPRGTRVVDALTLELAKANVDDVEIDDSDATLAQAAVWKPNANRLDILNDLCKLGGFYSPFFDNMGTCRIVEVPALDAVEPLFVYDIGTSVYRDTIVETDDLLKAPNSYVVVNSSITTSPIFGEWKVPSSAPNSYARRGFWVVSEHDVQTVSSNAQAARTAQAIGQADYATYRWVNLEAVTNPLHDTFDVVGWKGDKYREQGWEIVCSAGAHHKHEWRRIWSDAVADDLVEGGV